MGWTARPRIETPVGRRLLHNIAAEGPPRRLQASLRLISIVLPEEQQAALHRRQIHRRPKASPLKADLIKPPKRDGSLKIVLVGGAVGLCTLGEKEDRGRGDASVGAEHARGHRGDGIEAIFFDDFFARLNMGVRRAEQHAVGNDDGATPAIIEEPKE
jgi:hypothetical protein